MEVERLVQGLQDIVKYCPDSVKEAFGRIWVSERENGFPELNKHRTIATACKILASDPTIPDGLRIAGALMQMTGAGGAKPYEVESEGQK